MVGIRYFQNMLAIALLFALQHDVVADDVPSVQIQTLWQSGEGGYHTYRIPSLLVTKSGTVLAFCEARKNDAEDTGKIDLVCRRSTDGGKSWLPQQVVWSDGENTCGNPCPVVDQNSGDVVLLMTHNLGRDREWKIIAGDSQGTRTVWITRSRDDGQTWQKPTEITRDTKRPNWAWYATGPGVGIQLRHEKQRGRLVIPCDYIELKTGQGGSHVILSDDGGKTWRIGGVVPGRGTNECQVAELSDGRLLLNMRNYKTPHRQRAISTTSDGGETWSEVTHDAALPEPICQASLIGFEPKDAVAKPWLLFSNPADIKKRERLTVRLSQDDGASWTASRLLYEGVADYSSLAILPDGRIGCLFGCDNYAKINLATFDLSWLIGQ